MDIKGNLNSSRLRIFINTNEYKIIEQSTDWMSNDVLPSNRIYSYNNSITYPPKCPCGNLVKFANYKTGYKLYCGMRCGIKYSNRQDKIEKTK